MIGLPYASAAVDDLGYHVICPECGVRCYGSGTVEDNITKGAATAYADHYVANHQEVEP